MRQRINLARLIARLVSRCRPPPTMSGNRTVAGSLPVEPGSTPHLTPAGAGSGAGGTPRKLNSALGRLGHLRLVRPGLHKRPDIAHSLAQPMGILHQRNPHEPLAVLPET